ncbi:cytochrome c oxidase assembly protein COX16-domain-containing protein [Schizophyllum amplum]|uniref:Cytochrome c oxidase assembly protein COX16, mitochondrial n=1 Tax=Schizophyllum amplum TaxID=97359 RepID=A0A550C950_9AGAR|nr:cytochrome c oxidase assembly protein COX16-domain-containing protein [Auriculariopsis ampla]
MPAFQRRPLSEGKFYQTLNKNPLLFGIPFCLLMVGASYAMVPFTQTRYDLHDKKVQVMTKEQELNLQKNRKKFDIREEYYRLSQEVDDTWEQKRVPRPTGTPEWGVAPAQSNAVPDEPVTLPKKSS